MEDWRVDVDDIDRLVLMGLIGEGVSANEVGGG